MTFSYDETKDLIDFVLRETKAGVRNSLHLHLSLMERKESEFCMSVIEHGRDMSYTSEQWADLISKVPNINYKNEHWLMNKLSPKQRELLGLE